MKQGKKTKSGVATEKDFSKIREELAITFESLLKRKSILTNVFEKDKKLKKLFNMKVFEELLDDKTFVFLYTLQILKQQIIEISNNTIVEELSELKAKIKMIENHIDDQSKDSKYPIY